MVVAGEYLVMAATLLQIKSRMLLPRPEPQCMDDDPRLEIVKPLQELAKLKNLADRLEEMPWLDRDVFTREVAVEFEFLEEKDASGNSGSLQPELPPIEAGILDLINALQNVLGNSALPRSLEITRARATLAQRMEVIEEQLQRDGRARLKQVLRIGLEEKATTTILSLIVVRIMPCCTKEVIPQ